MSAGSKSKINRRRLAYRAPYDIHQNTEPAFWGSVVFICTEEQELTPTAPPLRNSGAVYFYGTLSACNCLQRRDVSYEQHSNIDQDKIFRQNSSYTLVRVRVNPRFLFQINKQSNVFTVLYRSLGSSSQITRNSYTDKVVVAVHLERQRVLSSEAVRIQRQQVAEKRLLWEVDIEVLLCDLKLQSAEEGLR